MNTCYVIAGGEFDGFFDEIKKGDFIIAADRGYQNAKSCGIIPDLIIGDFDSTDEPSSLNVIKLNPIKDYTDTMAALMIAVEKGFKKIIIYGGMGGRDSHTFSNIRNALYFKKKGIDITLRSKYKKIFIINSEFSYEFNDEEDFYVSVFSLNDISHGVCLNGLYYELRDYDMSLDDSIGVSNETCKRDFSISVREGNLLIIFEDKAI